MADVARPLDEAQPVGWPGATFGAAGVRRLPAYHAAVRPHIPRPWRRRLLGALLAAAVVGLVSFGGVYAAFFEGSNVPALSISSSPRPSASASAAGSAAPGSAPAHSLAPSQLPGTWTIAPGSVAGYRVREKLAFLAAPSDAVGRTSKITGALTLVHAKGGLTVSAASFIVNVASLTSDQAARDQEIRSIGLQSDRYPQASFRLTTPILLPAAATTGTTVRVTADGDLTIHGVTRAVAIPLRARLVGRQIETVGSISFAFGEFGMTPPNLAGLVTVRNTATMEFELYLRKS